jgi:hypothetical protein
MPTSAANGTPRGTHCSQTSSHVGTRHRAAGNERRPRNQGVAASDHGLEQSWRDSCKEKCETQCINFQDRMNQ